MGATAMQAAPADLADLLLRLREGINPVWSDIRGTESYERREAVEAIESLRADLELATRDLGITMGSRAVVQAELDKTRAALAEVRLDLWDTGELNGRLSEILDKTAVAARGPEPDLTQYGWADLPERVEALRRIADCAAASVNMEGWAGVCDEDAALVGGFLVAALESAGLIPGPPLPAQD